MLNTLFLVINDRYKIAVRHGTHSLHAVTALSALSLVHSISRQSYRVSVKYFCSIKEADLHFVMFCNYRPVHSNKTLTIGFKTCS